jgi:hypothetical protein
MGVRQRHAPATLTPEKRPVIHCTGGWVVPSAGTENLALSRDWIPGSFSL